MDAGVSHSRSDETPAAKVAWFRTLTEEERLDYLGAITDLALALNPDIAEVKDAQPVPGRVQVLTLPRR